DNDCLDPPDTGSSLKCGDVARRRRRGLIQAGLDVGSSNPPGDCRPDGHTIDGRCLLANKTLLPSASRDELSYSCYRLSIFPWVSLMFSSPHPDSQIRTLREFQWHHDCSLR